jgi:predicted RNA-binding Zn-ribbon protein involved in translation (DUF1610 family)
MFARQVTAFPKDLDRSCWNGGVPWCATCDRFLSPSTVRTDGSCPTCGASVDAGRVKAHAGQTKPRSIPWHVKALLGVFAIYLGYRAFQGLEWVARQL